MQSISVFLDIAKFADSQWNSWGVSRDSYISWIFLRQDITVPSFTIAGYM